MFRAEMQRKAKKKIMNDNIFVAAQGQNGQCGGIDLPKHNRLQAQKSWI